MENDHINPIAGDEVSSVPAPSPAPSSDTRNRLAAARKFAVEQYEKVRHYTREAREHINHGWNATCHKVKDLHHSGEEFVKANPNSSVLGALGIGLLLGYILGSSRR